MADNKTAPPPSATADLDGLGWAGHAITAALGLLALVAAIMSYKHGIQITLTISLLVAGGFLPILSWFSLQRSREAWSFLISLSVVLGIMTLFGAPKVRTLVGLPWSIALVIPALFLFAVFALTAQSHRYKK